MIASLRRRLDAMLARGAAISRWTGSLAGALLLCSCAHASAPVAYPQAPAVQAQSQSPEHVVRIVIAKGAAAASGGHGELRVALVIAPGYHVMSDRPRNPLYIPTRVRFDAEQGVVWGEPRYPPPQSFRFADEAIATFEGEIELRLPFELASDAAPGVRQLAGTLEYQACTRTSCLFPVKRPISAQIEVTR